MFSFISSSSHSHFCLTPWDALRSLLALCRFSPAYGWYARKVQLKSQRRPEPGHALNISFGYYGDRVLNLTSPMTNIIESLKVSESELIYIVLH